MTSNETGQSQLRYLDGTLHGLDGNVIKEPICCKRKMQVILHGNGHGWYFYSCGSFQDENLEGIK